MGVAGLTALLLLVAGSIFFTSGTSKLNVDAERITISEIKKGPFQEFIPVNGIVMPVTTIYLDAIEGGRVEEKYVEDGAMLKRGDPILKLANTDLELSLANQQTAVFNVLTQMQISHDQAQQNTIGKLQTMADVDNALKEADRIYKLDKNLYAQKAIGLQEYQAAVNAYDYAVRKKKLTTQILKQDSTATRQQVTQAKESYDNMKSTLELMKKKVGDLIVRAPISGQLTAMDAEVGQNKNKGEHLGQMDVLSGFKIRASVDEHYISRVFTGLIAYYTTDEQTYKLTVKKVFTQVNNGQFDVDMAFVGASPKALRKGQTLQIRLTFSDEMPALLLPRGGFYQQTGGNWIFKVSDDGKTAYKTDIQLNRQSPDYYEVIKGLKPGDKVITSSYETYGDIQELVLKK
ncbi:HlyD family secretion protein [Mucilaginibacter yixingensis]|uniref:HlyD family secretion protein n=2 Tax=Mucilaginibacter yixingensis TaxID=1295612 RepID=A0A2T5JGP1_9SPHI|nr:HlyD family secretion protein [Mucilaginibacter yixingensis]